MATLRPSTALSTEIAGVMIPSPYNSAEPNRPAATSRRPKPRGVPLGRASARRARMPPSPRLSARITIDRYLNVTTKLSDQTISDRMPSTFCSFTGNPWVPKKHSLKA